MFLRDFITIDSPHSVQITAKVFYYMKLFYPIAILCYLKLRQVFIRAKKNAFSFIFTKMSWQLIINKPFLHICPNTMTDLSFSLTLLSSVWCSFFSLLDCSMLLLLYSVVWLYPCSIVSTYFTWYTDACINFLLYAWTACFSTFHVY